MTTQVSPAAPEGTRTGAKVEVMRREGSRLIGPDALAVGVLLVVTAVVAWNRMVFDSWLARFDLMTFFVPWYQLLGERLRDFEIPAWNPHLFSGMPQAGDPESGWGYLPAMLLTPLLAVTAAIKAQVALQLLVAGLSTYGLARRLGMGALGALGAALVFVCGPYLKWSTHCCLIFSQWATWVPLALLGVEWALRAGRWRDRVAPWFVTGFAVSQMLAGWIGEGWLYAGVLPAAYAGYRTLVPPRPTGNLRGRLLVGAATGVAGPVLGLALGAAGVLPRLTFSAESFLAGGYEQLPGGGVLNPPWTTDRLLGWLFGAGYETRGAALGGAVVVLAALGVLIGRERRRWAVPFFAALTLIPPFLALERSPFHLLFGLLPRWTEFHEHDAWRAIALMSIGPALLVGAALESLTAWRGRRALVPIIVVPFLLLMLVVAIQRGGAWPIGRAPIVAAAVATVLLVVGVLVPRRGRHRPPTSAKPEEDGSAPLADRLRRGVSPRVGRDGVGRWLAVGLLAVVVVQPTALELSGSWWGWPRDPSWEGWWRPDPAVERGLRRDLAATDPGGAGEFLQARLAEAGPFRYVGYGGVGWPEQQPPAFNYMGRRIEPAIGAILVNGRPMALGLYDVQGYDPLQLGRYVDFVAALNGQRLDYHVAYVLPSGLRSPLLDLLNVRYVVVDASLPSGRADVAAIAAEGREVFRSPLAVVYDRVTAPVAAWVVGDVRPVAPEAALAPVANREIVPRRTALVEVAVGEALPAGLGPAHGLAEAEASAGTAAVTRYEPERIELDVAASGPSLLVVSEVYESGWRAYVNGERVEILPTFHALRGVPVPAGASTVELRYEPPALRAGLAISGVAIVGMLGSFGMAGLGWLRRVRRA